MLAPTLSVGEAARLLGVSRDVVYETIARGEFVVETLRIGRRVRVPSRPLLGVLGIDEATAVAALETPGLGAGP